MTCEFERIIFQCQLFGIQACIREGLLFDTGVHDFEVTLGHHVEPWRLRISYQQRAETPSLYGLTLSVYRRPGVANPPPDDLPIRCTITAYNANDRPMGQFREIQGRAGYHLEQRLLQYDNGVDAEANRSFTQLTIKMEIITTGLRDLPLFEPSQQEQIQYRQIRNQRLISKGRMTQTIDSYYASFDTFQFPFDDSQKVFSLIKTLIRFKLTGSGFFRHLINQVNYLIRPGNAVQILHGLYQNRDQTLLNNVKSFIAWSINVPVPHNLRSWSLDMFLDEIQQRRREETAEFHFMQEP